MTMRHNLDLTDRRAKAVRVYLIDKGIDGNRLQAHGYGETNPVCMEHNEDCWSRKPPRRVRHPVSALTATPRTSQQAEATLARGAGSPFPFFVSPS